MNNAICPEALKTLRKQKGWSQIQLAEKSHCSKEQISRWERGQSLKLNSNSRERLTKVFGVSWEELTRPPKPNDEYESKWFPTVQLNVRVRPEARAALILACLRYKVRPADIIELAPLLFLITAEKSLAARQTKIDAIDEQWERAAEESTKAAPHLAPAFFIPSDANEAIASEQESIRRREVFGPEESFDVDDYDPFVVHLKHLLKDLPDGLIEDLSPRYSRGPDYRIAEDALCEITGISGETENEQELLLLISEGSIDLRELLSKKQNLSEKDYFEWLSTQAENVKTEQEARNRELIGDFGGFAEESSHGP